MFAVTNDLRRKLNGLPVTEDEGELLAAAMSSGGDEGSAKEIDGRLCRGKR